MTPSNLSSKTTLQPSRNGRRQISRFIREITSESCLQKTNQMNLFESVRATAPSSTKLSSNRPTRLNFSSLKTTFRSLWRLSRCKIPKKRKQWWFCGAHRWAFNMDPHFLIRLSNRTNCNWKKIVSCWTGELPSSFKVRISFKIGWATSPQLKCRPANSKIASKLCCLKTTARLT